MSKASYLLAATITALVHLAVIPVLSIYGVHICPVLSELGFWFGCKYNAVFSVSVFTLNVVLVSLAWASLYGRFAKDHSTLASLEVFRYFPFFSLLLHFTAFLLGAYFLNSYLHTLDVPSPTLAKMNVAFFYTAVLIGVLQSSIIDWVIQGWLRLQSPSASEEPSLENTKKAILSLTAHWAFSYFWQALPQIAVLTVAITYVCTKFMNLANRLELGPEVVTSISQESLKILALLLGWFMLIRVFTFLKEKRLVDSVHRHLQALSKMDSSHYSATIASGFWEEIFKALNHTSGIIEQRSRLMKGLSTYATSSVVSHVLTNRDLKTHGELRELTILVSDLRNFTQISNSMSAENIVRMLNIYFADMLEVLTIHGATVDKFIGDGILAYVDEKGIDPNAARQRGVGAALAMQEKIFETNRKLSSEGLPELKLGVAVHCGPVVLGSIGAQEKMQYTVIGDAVNATSRLEGLCKNLDSGVIISEIVWESLPAHLMSRFKDLGEQEIRGLKLPLHVYGVLQQAFSEQKAA